MQSIDESERQFEMNHEGLFRWSKRLHLVLTVGGGFLGFCNIVQAIASDHDRQAAEWVIVLIFAFLYFFGVVCGLRYNEGSDRWRPLLVYYLIQIPMFTSPSLSYFFTSAFSLAFGLWGGTVGLNGGLGSTWMFTIHHMQPWGIAINLVPLLLLLSLFRVNSRRKTELDKSTL